ncbi:MAG: N-6 DNA methylase [Pseudonocardiaceae bacterium]
MTVHLTSDTVEARKARGAFYTPPELCRYMADWAIRSASDEVLEPSCGQAAFLLAAGEPLVAQRPETNPWVLISPGGMQYFPDYQLLEAMLGVPIGEGAGSQSDRLAKVTDAWVSHELRRAGFGADEVWPRLTASRILPREVNLFVKSLPAAIRRTAEASLARNRAVASSDARSLGRASGGRTSTGRRLLVAEWSDVNPTAGVRIRHDAVPDDLSAARFLATLVDAVLQRTPVEMHVEVRQRREHRDLPLDEGDTP